jgi:hypothetical protein
MINQHNQRDGKEEYIAQSREILENGDWQKR